jgi:hypothetical protein
MYDMTSERLLAQGAIDLPSTAAPRSDAGESVVDLAWKFGVDRPTLYRMQAAEGAEPL